MTMAKNPLTNHGNWTHVYFQRAILHSGLSNSYWTINIVAEFVGLGFHYTELHYLNAPAPSKAPRRSKPTGIPVTNKYFTGNNLVNGKYLQLHRSKWQTWKNNVEQIVLYINSDFLSTLTLPLIFPY